MMTESALFEGDEKKRFIHIYFSDGRAYGQKQEIKKKISRLKLYLSQCVGRERKPFGAEIRKYFHIHYEKDGKTLKLAEENTRAIEEELSLAGYFVIVSSDKLTAKEAIELALSSKIFIQFLALILRSMIYTALKDKCETMMKRLNYMTVPAAEEDS